MKTLFCITHYSCLHSILSPKKIVSEAKKLGYTSLGIADIDNMSGSIEFYLECKKAGIKPVIGMRHNDLLYFALNKNGYKELVSLCYDINLKKDFNFSSKNVIVVPDNGSKPRFLKGDKKLFDIVVATREHKKIDNIEDILKSYNDDWFGNESANDLEIENSVEEYDITSKPVLPLFNNKEDNSELFRQICEKQLNLEFPDNQIYRDRLEKELKVLQNAKLENYFLIIKDIMDWARSQGYLLGPGRGSVGGSLVAYLLNISQVDPIKYDLIFERFYNDGRNNENYTAMPDIDIDVPKRSRGPITEYISNKYGVEKVSKIGTYQTLMGRSALSAVFRATTDIGFTELKKITKVIKDKAAISDDLQEMVSQGKKKSVIMWGLENEASKLRDYCELKNGKLEGQYAEQFAIAIELEETKCALSEHAAGVLISREDLRDCCPMVRNHEYLISGCEMEEIEQIGLIKLDLLGLKTLDIIEDI